MGQAARLTTQGTNQGNFPMFTKTVNPTTIDKVELGFPGVTMQLLTGDVEGNGLYVMTTMAPGSTIPAHSHSTANEFVYVVSGDFVEAGVSHGPGTVFYGVADTAHGPHTTKDGCVVLTHYSAPLDFVPAS
jgi:anti-sigma factor ChrR (cupin superfamily)